MVIPSSAVLGTPPLCEYKGKLRRGIRRAQTRFSGSRDLSKCHVFEVFKKFSESFEFFAVLYFAHEVNEILLFNCLKHGRARRHEIQANRSSPLFMQLMTKEQQRGDLFA